MAENLYYSLDQLALMQVKHKAGCSKPLDGFKGVLQHLLRSVSVHGYVVQVDNYGQGVVTQHAMKDTLDYKLEINGHLCKAHQYPEPPELALVGIKGRVIRSSTLKWDIVEASLQVQHADPLSPPKLHPIPLHVI